MTTQLMTSTSTIYSPAFDYNFPQLLTKYAPHHKQMVSNLLKPYMKEIKKVLQEIEDEYKNTKPKVHFLIYDKDQPLRVELNCVGSADIKNHKHCFAYGIQNRWIRTDESDFDTGYFHFLSNFAKRVLHKKSHLVFVVVNGYICGRRIISPNTSPRGVGGMR